MITSEFRFYMLWNEYRVSDHLKLDVTNKDDVILAVRKAYIDMQVRTIGGLGLKFLDDLNDDEKAKLKDEIGALLERKTESIKQVKEWLAEEISKIFKGEREFNHTKLCTEFLNIFIKAIEEINNSVRAFNVARNADENSHTIDTSNIHFGKAQKIVNMTLKYLMLFDNAQEHEDIFRKSHMPIDSYIIDYFNKVDNLGIKKSWSNFEKEDYISLQEYIKTYCKTEVVTAGGIKLIGYPLYDEFTIWHEGKNIKK